MPPPPPRLFNQLTLAEATHLQAQLLEATSLQVARHCASRFLAEHPALSVELTFNQPLWRVRPTDYPSGFASIHDLLAPPSEHTRPGRANHEKEPKLYLSARVETALAEKEAQPNTHYHAIAVMPCEGAHFRLALLGEQHHVVRKDHLDNFGYDPADTIKNSLRTQGPERAERIAFADALMAEVFTDPGARARDYIPSRGLADALIHHAGMCDGIMYPSVRHDLGKNYCIDPRIAHQRLRVVASMVLRVDRLWLKGYYSMTPTASHVLDEDQSGRLKPVELRKHGPVWFNLSDAEAERLDLNKIPGS